MDPRLEKLNQTWKELTEQASRLSQAAAQQRELERQHAERKERVAETGAIYRKEQDDVDTKPCPIWSIWSAACGSWGTSRRS